jgi:hypothetical protein
MPDELSKVEFALDETIGGQPLTPDTVDLPTSRGLLADERALAELWRKGREAWRDVPSAVDWVEELRGNSLL